MNDGSCKSRTKSTAEARYRRPPKGNRAFAGAVYCSSELLGKAMLVPNERFVTAAWELPIG